jgi:uncharacterized protein
MWKTNDGIRLRLLAFWLAAGTVLIQGCSRETSVPADVTDPLLQSRKERDIAFKSSPESPIPAQSRPGFRGLDYYPPNPGLRFRVKLNRFSVPERIRLTTNTGEVREALRYGYFEFQIQGITYRLHSYRIEDDANPGEPSLFIPFRDATTGKETYEGGRYLDLPENTSGVYDLDFNYAYNPFCAYGGDFSCPVPPEENRMGAAIHAGEKAYLRGAGTRLPNP